MDVSSEGMVVTGDLLKKHVAFEFQGTRQRKSW